MSRIARWFGMASWVAVVVIALASPASAQRGHNSSDDAVGARGNPGVLPPGSNPYGKSYGEWGAAWWQWVFSSPWPQNPLNDPTGANAAQGQSGPVWFLAGTVCTGNACNLLTANRTSTVPPGKALFFPILNTECSTYEGNGSTEADLLACATGAIDSGTGLECDVDGTSLVNLGDYRAHSALFTWGPLPADNLFDGLGFPTPAGTTSPAVQDGYYVMLAPLPAGTHTVHFTGAYAGFSTLDIVYHLTVQGNGKSVSTAVPASLTAPATDAEGRHVTWGKLKAAYR